MRSIRLLLGIIKLRNQTICITRKKGSISSPFSLLCKNLFVSHAGGAVGEGDLANVAEAAFLQGAPHHHVALVGVDAQGGKPPFSRHVLGKAVKPGGQISAAEFGIHSHPMHRRIGARVSRAPCAADLVVGGVAVEQKGKTEGIGRIGELPEAVPFKEFAAMLKDRLGLDAIRLVGDGDKMVKKVGLCTGSGVSFASLAAAKGCDAYLTGDIKYHEAQDAIEKGIGVVDVTHYASEVLIVPVLQKKLTEAAKENGWDIEVVCSGVNGQTFWSM